MKPSKTKSEHGHALYARPRYYDHAFRAHRRDLDYYVELARRARGPVLELGAGTGRVTLALLRAGVEVTAVDRSASMLARLRDRAAALPQAQRAGLRAIEADLRSLQLKQRFELILAPFNLLMHMYTREDVESALACVRRHLRPSGKLAFDVLMPDLGVLRRDPARFYRCRPVFDPSDGHRYAYAERFAYDPLKQLQTITMQFQRLDKPSEEREIVLVLRSFFPAELQALLHYNGFRVLSHLGDFAGEALDANSESQVVIAGLAKR
ncbi:MAG TPA: class I SAM-dependent methyltransferase [Polyangiales bacterium]|nr:class I SAM-dependent methyltransferase [Polyangiales bacterium]